MPRFNFTNITLQSKADITDIMDNFNKIENAAALSSELTEAVNTLNNMITTKETELKQTATVSKNGMMSSSDKSKLNGIQSNANNYTLPQASSTLGGVKTTSTVTDVSTYTPVPIVDGIPYYKDTNTTYPLSSTDTNGIMSYQDKQKLDGIQTGANRYVLPTAGSSLGGVKTTSSVSSIDGYTPVPIINGVPYYKNTTYNNASTSVAGLMSTADKIKLNGIANNATAVSIINNLTSDSTAAALSAKQGKLLNEAINTKQKSITIGTSNPSGGSAGDIYIQYFN